MYLKYSIDASEKYFNNKLTQCANDSDWDTYRKVRKQFDDFKSTVENFRAQLPNRNAHWLLIDLNRNKPGRLEAALKLNELIDELNTAHPQIKLYEKTEFN